MAKITLARVRDNLTENATVAQVLHPDIKAMGVEFTVTKPGRYEIVVDRRDGSVELFEVPEKSGS